MDVPIYYAISLGAAIASWLCYQAIWKLQSLIRSLAVGSIRRHFMYPLLFGRFAPIGTVTRAQALIVVCYMVVNVVCMTFRAPTLDVISTRAGLLALINMIPLLSGPRITLPLRILALSTRTNLGIHIWLGRTAIAQAMTHVAMSTARDRAFKWDNFHLSGVIGSSILLALFLTSLTIVRRMAYECFLRSHFVLSAAMLVAVWRHIAAKKVKGKLLVWIGMLVWTVCTAVNWTLFIFRNVVLGHSLPRAQIHHVIDACRVDIVVPRSWNVTAGQYVYVTIPGSSIWSFFQSHPFEIVWWHYGTEGLEISLLVEPRRGFTGKLSHQDSHPMRTLIDGPYGLHSKFGDFGTILMFATGIGIAGQIPHVKELLEKYGQYQVRTRRITLLWQLEKECHENWVYEWMNILLGLDKDYIFRVEIFVLNNYGSKATAAGDVKEYGDHERIKKTYASMNVTDILNREFEQRKGAMMVSTCALPIITDEVRSKFHQEMGDLDQFIQLDFQPSRRIWRL